MKGIIVLLCALFVKAWSNLMPWQHLVLIAFANNVCLSGSRRAPNVRRVTKICNTRRRRNLPGAA